MTAARVNPWLPGFFLKLSPWLSKTTNKRFCPLQAGNKTKQNKTLPYILAVKIETMTAHGLLAANNRRTTVIQNGYAMGQGFKSLELLRAKCPSGSCEDEGSIGNVGYD